MAPQEEIVRRHFDEFRALVVEARALADRGRFNAAAITACAAAYAAQYRHPGLFASRELEQVLLDIGRRTMPARRGHSAAAGPGAARRVLHVSTNVAAVGGIPGLIRRWIRQDSGRAHSLALTTQAPDAVPQALADAVAATGGRTHILNGRRGGLIARARRLGDVALTADLIVLHSWEQDVVPTLAFARAGEFPPIVYVNHGDHWFWLGSAILDVLANLRESGMRLSLERRHVTPAQNMLLPTIMEPVTREMSREEAKRRIGVPAGCTLLLSIARPPKFRTVDGVTFADAHVPALTRHPDAELLVVGAGAREEWSAAISRTGGRIRSLDPTTDTAVYYQAADIYVDSYPFGSNTSLLQAASYGVPVVTRHSYSQRCAILGSDMPGLDRRLIRVSGVDEYTQVLSSLIRDENARKVLGEATRGQVESMHWGADWQCSLEAVYARALTRPRRTADSARDVPCFEEPDIYLPRIHGGNYRPEWPVYFHLSAMSLADRVRQWLRLGAAQGFRLPYSYLLPDWLYCRYATRRA